MLASVMTTETRVPIPEHSVGFLNNLKGYASMASYDAEEFPFHCHYIILINYYKALIVHEALVKFQHFLT